jgi:hypothetical protein
MSFEALLDTLAGAGIEFVLVGGLAATAHGSARATYDMDVVYSRAPDNIDRLVSALAKYEPYLRGAPPGLPFRFDRETVLRGLNFTLSTNLGPLDLFGEIAGGGAFEALLPHCVELRLLGRSVRCLTLDKLIEVKRAAGRPKDLEAVAELEALREEGRP